MTNAAESDDRGDGDASRGERWDRGGRAATGARAHGAGKLDRLLAAWRDRAIAFADAGRFTADIKSNNFDVIRLFLALLVIYSHSYPGVGLNDREPLSVLTRGQSTLGEISVLSFFMISGFLITRSWAGTPRLGDYLSKRVRRIYPGFIVSCLICLLVVGPIGALGHAGYWAGFNPFGFAGRLLLLNPRFPQTFHGKLTTDVNGSLWTIRWEFLCYLCVPVVALLGCLRRRRRLAALFAASMLLLIIKSYAAPHINFPGRLATAFVAGQIFYVYSDKIVYRRTWFYFAAAVMLFSAVASRLNLYHILFPIFGGYVLFYVAFAKVKVLGWLKASLRGVDISYGVYLYGWPIEGLILWVSRTPLNPNVLFLMTAPASLIVGTLSWYLVERHFLHHRSSRTTTVKAGGPARARVEPSVQASTGVVGTFLLADGKGVGESVR
jgi:peptidoglycan/LPS O-acetylase OafA/YrhL